MYTNPIDICVGPYGDIFIITYDNVKMESKIFKEQQHSPVDWILKVGERTENVVEKWTSILL